MRPEGRRNDSRQRRRLLELGHDERRVRRARLRATQPAAGTTAALKFAFEANNPSAARGRDVFSLNWKVPTARLKSAQVLSGVALDATASDGHPSASGYKWYFGDSPIALALSACTAATCVPTLQATGSHYYWVTVPYSQIGYTTRDYAGDGRDGNV